MQKPERKLFKRKKRWLTEERLTEQGKLLKIKGSEVKNEAKKKSVGISRREDKSPMTKPGNFNENVLAVLIRERGER